MFKYKEKNGIYLQYLECSSLHCIEVTQIVCYAISACFPFEPLEKCMIVKDIFAGLSWTLTLISRTLEDQSNLEFSRKNPGLSRRRGQWRSPKFVMEEVLAPLPLSPFPFMPLPSPFSFPLPSLPLELGLFKSS